MARKTAKPKEIEFGNITWVLNNLTDKELAAFDQMNPDYSKIFADLGEDVEAGWKLSAKWDTRSGAFQVTMIANLAEMENAGFALSARSDDLLDAYGLVWYKLHIIAQVDLSEYKVDKTHVRG